MVTFSKFCRNESYPSGIRSDSGALISIGECNEFDALEVGVEACVIDVDDADDVGDVVAVTSEPVLVVVREVAVKLGTWAGLFPKILLKNFFIQPLKSCWLFNS